MLTEQDLKQIREKGIDQLWLEKQLENFRNGFPYVKLVRPANKNDGIIIFDNDKAVRYAAYYEEKIKHLKAIKFVPASGAASRMFQHLYEFLEYKEEKRPDIQELINDKGFNSLNYLIGHIHELPFYEALKLKLSEDGYHLENELKQRNYGIIIDYILREHGLNYASLPKGLILFHKYEDGPRLAIEEHLVEGAMYCRSLNNEVYIHFTVSPEHKQKFIETIEMSVPKYEKKFQVSYKISFSEQKPSTDMVAVDMDNEFFREEDGSLLFRPGGHGALIENLNDLKADIVFIKNVDNIIPDRLKDQTILYKKVIGGYLIHLQERIHTYLYALEDRGLNMSTLEEIEEFAKNELMICFSNDYKHAGRDEKIAMLFGKLSRPARVCGMVKNEGEPGGGPFWILNQKGEVSLQIVETSQVNLSDPAQLAIIKKASHFNPVDLVCAINDYKGKPFDLTDYIDHSTGFISIKSKDGRNLKAQELPGLWNGAMADWITLFVDVPLITFNPVKTVNDLLRKEHLY